MAWRIEYARSVQKDIRRLDPPVRRQIHAYLEERIAALDDPRSLGKPLTGHFGGLWRYRIGNHRVICEIEDGRLVVLVLTIGHRREVYR